jgi:peptidoglycan L-alanyl-D-glutamate endopeptidase CwlK
MNSKHLVDEKNPLSRAIDIAPEPLNWDNIQAFIKLADKFMAKAEELRKAGKITHKIRWGGDWNMNGEWKDEKFRDLVHFELL